MSTPEKPVLGLIGAIGAGKSAAAALLAKRGGFVIDADRVGHEVLDHPAVKDRIVNRWGEKILQDGRVSRRAVGAIVFADPAERLALESMVYPEIEARCRTLIAEAQPMPEVRFIVLDAAVMLEARWSGIVDKLLYLDASRSLREERVAGRGWTPAELTRRKEAQWPEQLKMSLADAVITNDGTLVELETALNQQLQTWGWI